jgi:hypothetical protein
MVGAIAFLAGLQLGGRPADGPSVVTPPSTIASPLPVRTAAASLEATPSPAASRPRWSEFVRTFLPLGLIATIPGGTKCVGNETGAALVPAGPAHPFQTYGSAWVLLCPVPPSHQASFIAKVIETVATATPTSGYSSSSIDGPSRIIAIIPYNETPFAGTVTVGAVETKGSLLISIALEEQLAP